MAAASPALSPPKDKALSAFHPAVQAWFTTSFEGPTRAQKLGWKEIAAGRSTLLLAPTGSGKTLAAFLAALDKLCFAPAPDKDERLKVLYVSPLKALGVDVEKNLRAPILGIAKAAERLGHGHRELEVAVRTGDTPARERARFGRHPPDILITTPESLFLLLTSEARERMRFIDTVILDEIHSVAATKRGAHLMLSLERLEAIRKSDKPLQRIGLSATQRPLEVIAKLLGGLTAPKQARHVAIVDAGSKRELALKVEVAVEDMKRPAEDPERDEETAHDPSIWPSIHPKLLDLIRSHRSTMIFVNSRRLAERLANALNELAEEEVALAHHGSIAREARLVIEDRLKAGSLPAIVATSSLELGIDMGAVDLVVQVEAPPSVASGLQRVGRASHHVGGRSKGILIPKYRADLLSCAVATELMESGKVEPTRYPQSPLDVLAQQIVAIVSMGDIAEAELFDLVRRAAPFEELPRSSFDGVLDMLSGRYPSDEFAELRPRIVWDRVAGVLRPRRGAKRLAIVNAGTIPDRGLYGVFLNDGGDGKHSRRVGELDEEMVFESRVGEIFLLGASSWRIDDITHDRVLVSPAPGEPGKMPFWHGDRPGRPFELGRAIGELTHRLGEGSHASAVERLVSKHHLDAGAADNLVRYVREQKEATGQLPTHKCLVVERFLDEIGDYRICILSPFGARVHGPWALSIMAQWIAEGRGEIDAIWSDDGIVFRVPEAEEPPPVEQLLPRSDEVEDRLTESVGKTALFASRFRENAGRALLLPRKHPGRRSPLWAQRKRSADLLQVASQYGSFPILLETYRECLKDVFDLPALRSLLQGIESRSTKVATVDTQKASPFASNLLFAYAANFIYEGDAPLAERRAQALSIDIDQLRELLGEAELRELLDPEAIAEREAQLSRLSRPATHADGVHDLLLSVGMLTRAELEERAAPRDALEGWLQSLLETRRIIEVGVGDRRVFAAAEDASRLRDALGVAIPLGLPHAFTESVADPLGDLVARFGRTHGPFTVDDVAAYLGLAPGAVLATVERKIAQGKWVRGGFRPGSSGVELCDADVLRSLKRGSIAKHRKQAEPVDHATYARFLTHWHDVRKPLRGVDGLLSGLEQLQGAPLVASTLFSDVLPARVHDFHVGDLDELCASGEIVWRGMGASGPGDGRIAFYLADQYDLLAPAPEPVESEVAAQIRAALQRRGALFFHDLVGEVGGFRGEIFETLWDMIWAGEITNDTLLPVRSLLAGEARDRRQRVRPGRGGRPRRLGPPGSEGRFSLTRPVVIDATTVTRRRAALAEVLLERHGVLCREGVLSESLTEGGFGPVYEVLKALEDTGKVRRGYFVEGLGATQFARPGAEDRLRSYREPPEEPEIVVLGATDPANPYGSVLPWPPTELHKGRFPGASVVLIDGHLRAFLGRGDASLTLFPPADDAERANALRLLAIALRGLVEQGTRRTLLVQRIDGDGAKLHPFADSLIAVGFVRTDKGLLYRRARTESR